MKIALIHDYITEYGGAERVLEALHEIWPEAPVYTSVYLPEFLGPHRERFKDWKIKTSFLQHIPFKEKLISPFRIIAPFMFRMFDFSQYDVVIVSATGAYSSNSIQCHPELVSGSNSSGNEMPKLIRQAQSLSDNRRQVRHDKLKRPIRICYCHTPSRYLYGYATARDWKKNLLFRVFGEIGNHFLRLIDFKSSQNVDYFIANSKNVADRIKKFYRKDSIVIYPPVEISRFVIASGAKQSRINGIATSPRSVAMNVSPRNDNKTKGNQYFIAGGRLARPKHINLIVRACLELNVPLVVFGREFAGPNEFKTQPFDKAQGKNSKIKSTSQNSKIRFVGEITDEEKFELMRNARAYIFAAEDEDFGITPVEAMSVGTPVIAYKSGGVVESVLEGKTGLFFNELTVESLSRAIKQFNRVKRDNAINPNDCIKHAQKFSKERFIKEIKEFIENKLKE